MLLRIAIKTNICFLFTFLFLFFAQTSAKAIDLTKYFFPTGATGINMSSGEFFKVIDEGNGYYKIQKSQDPRYYERFRIQNGMIYHVEEATWATENGNVTCSDTGNEASARYVGGQTEWAPVNVSANSTFSTGGGRVVGWDKILQRECPTPYNGEFGKRTVEVSNETCVTFPNGVTSDKAVVLKILEGPGSGEQFVYDSNKGWVGFNREGGVDGAYATDTISTTKHALGECLQLKISNVKKTCPAGFTCIDTKPTPVFGKTIEVKRYAKRSYNDETGTSNSDIENTTGETGPAEGQFYFPKLLGENAYYSTFDLYSRSLPSDEMAKLDWDLNKAFLVQKLDGILAHPGCGQIRGGVSDGQAATVKANTDIDTTDDYENLLLRNRYFQSWIVPGYGATGRFTAPSVDKETIEGKIPENYADCFNETGVSLNEKVELPGGPVPTNILGALGSAFNWLLSSLGLRDSREFTFNIQQAQFLPGAKSFAKSSVDEESGFLNFFKPAEVQFTKTGDQDEIIPYKVFGKDEQVGVNYDEIAEYKAATNDLLATLCPADQTCNLESAVSSSTLTSPTMPSSTNTNTAGLYYSIPYLDSSVKISEENKRKFIAFVKYFWPDHQLESKWDQVYNEAVRNGINPAFMIAIWAEESGASSPRARANSDFGCFTGGNTDLKMSFESSMSCFVNFTAKEHPSDFTDWVRYFCGPKQELICSNNPNFIKRLKTYYDVIVPPGASGAATNK